MALMDQKDFAGALVHARASVTGFQTLRAVDPLPLSEALDLEGMCLLGLGRTREAVDVLRQALAFPSLPGEVLADTGFALAHALWAEGRAPEARLEAARARERFTQVGKAQRAAEVQSWLSVLTP